MRYRKTGDPAGQAGGETLNGWWFDPRVGAAFKIGQIAREGTKAFTPPSSGYGHDWVLVLDDAAQVPRLGRRNDVRQDFLIASILLTLVAIVPYVSDIMKGTTKPNLVSWMTWTMLAEKS